MLSSPEKIDIENNNAEQEKNEPTQENLEFTEEDLKKMAQEAIAQISTQEKNVLERAQQRIDHAPESINIDPQKAESIFVSSGIAERVSNIKEKIVSLGKKAKENIVALVSKKAETVQQANKTHIESNKPESSKESNRLQSLEQYMAERQPTGLEAAKEKARLTQLKLQGIKNPEKVLALAHYLEETAVVSDSKFLSVNKESQTDAVNKKAEKLRKQGFEVNVREDRSDNTKIQVYAHKETPYRFNATNSHLLKDLDEIIQSPNDPIKMFEALRDNGYKLEVRKDWTFGDSDKLKELFQNPDVLPLLERLKTFGGSSVTHDYLKRYDSFNHLSKFATRDTTEHILTPEAEKGIEKISSLLGQPISSADLEGWAKIAKDETAIDILTILKGSSEGVRLYESDWLHKLSAIKESGVENEVAALLKEGFTDERSFDELGSWSETTRKQAAENIKAATEAFQANPNLHHLVRGADKIFLMEDSIGRENMRRCQKLVEQIPEIGPALANMADMGIRAANRWEAEEYINNIDNPEHAAEYRQLFKAVAESDFKTFASACEKAGYHFTVKDFSFNSSGYSRLISSYRNEVFRSAILSKQGTELAKRLGIFEVPADRWNDDALEKLSQIPDALNLLQKLEESYGYKYNPNDDYNNYQLSNLTKTLLNSELLSKLLEPETVNTIQRARNEFSLNFSLGNSEEMVKIVEDPHFRDALQNSETTAFVKTALSERNRNFETVAALAKCDPKLRPIIERMVRDFAYEPAGKYIYSHEYDRETDDYIAKAELVLADTEKFQELSDNPKILEAQAKLEACGMRKNPLEDIDSLKKISENNLFNVFERCQGSPKIQEFFWHNLDKAITISQLSPEKMSTYLEIFQKIDDSPSQEIQRLKDSLLSQLLESQHPVEDYQKIESIFIKNNVPAIGKIYEVFEVLHDPENLKSKIGRRTSPILQQAGTRRRYYTIYQDLLKIHIESGNRSLKEYAEVLQSGGRLIEQYERNGLASLNPRQQEELRYFVGKLEALQAKSALDTADEVFKAADPSDFEQRFNHVRQGLKVAEGQTVLERISDMYLRPAGVKSLDELLEKMRDSKVMADRRGRQIVAEGRTKAVGGDITLDLKSGDFLKGVDARYIGNILQNGSVAKEFLGASSDSDLTPLDTDISLVLPEDAKGGFTNAINTSLANNYGEILLALKDRGQYQRTVIGQPAKAEADKIELFQTGVLNERHYGIRTGFPATEIDFIIVKDALTSQPKNLEKLYFEIAQNGYYIPVVDTSGKVIFTPEMYDEYRKSFAGLERFDGPALNYQQTTPDQRSYNQVVEIAAAIPENSRRVEQVTQTIRSEIEQALGKLGVSLRPEFDTSILGAELLDTGSTGRHTNMPGDFDFDFSLKLDAKDFPRSEELARAIKGMMTFTEDNSHREASGYYQLRLKGVSRIGNQQLEKPLDIDIGFASKSDLSVYGSHDAIRNKLDYIKTHNGQQAYEQTIANIILAKQILKEGHAYKKQEDGGFGGVGVENWILANGGNMETAFQSFRDTAYENGQRLPYEKFKEKYRILDPGTNIKFQSHDNFIDILKPEGYEKMMDIIENYIRRSAPELKASKGI